MDSPAPWNPLELWRHHRTAAIAGFAPSLLVGAVFASAVMTGEPIAAVIAMVAFLAWGVVTAHLLAGKQWILGSMALGVPALLGGALLIAILTLPFRIFGVEHPDLGQEVPPPTLPDSNMTPVTVFFATDRQRAQAEAFDFGTSRNVDGKLALGSVVVTVPRDHRIGDIERPTVWTLYREDPSRHFVIVEKRPLSYVDFYDGVASRVAASAKKEVFVFIHGFNVEFMDAVYRTAQIAYDLKFDGAPVLYSWPSAAALTPIGYATDAGNSDWTVPHLRWFLEDIAARSKAERIHLIAHSMGNKALVNALDRMPRSTGKVFSQIVLTAPDIDAGTFRQLADAVREHGQRTTLYASANDIALAASQRLQSYPRAGDTRNGVLVVPGIDTVDVSAVDTNFIGHFYYGDNTSVLSDLYLILTQNLTPSMRPRLRPVGDGPKQSWRFVP